MNPFALLFMTLAFMATIILGYSIIIYFIWNLGLVWVAGLPQMPFLTSVALGALFYFVMFAINTYNRKKREAELEARALDELRRFFDGEGK